MQLCPRMTIRPTSSAEIGQVYVPLVNWTLMVATIAVVLAYSKTVVISIVPDTASRRRPRGCGRS